MRYDMRMRRIGDIDLVEDEWLLRELTWWSLGILVVGTLLGVLMGVALPHEAIDVLWFVRLAAVSVLALVVHELVHALAFKLATGFRARVTFGISSLMPYTRSPGTVLSRHTFCWVLLAPAFVVTTALFVGAAVLGQWLLGYFLALLHLSGCTGDAAYVRVIMSEPRATFIEDTPRGISLIHDE